MNVIDLRSDTVTLPTPAMRDAMHAAALGDDVYDEDPTVNRLQDVAAEILGKEAALFVASGTMGNLVSLLTHCQRGDQAIIGERCHIALWEQGGASTLGGISLRTVSNQADGTLAADAVAAAVNREDMHSARSRLLCLENTWNGRPLTKEYTQEICALARQHGLKIHLDGARLFNAVVALKSPASELAAPVDSVQICFSKGLSAPVGSIICGSKDFIKEARRNRKVVGGSMRQVGVLAAACLVALETMVERLSEDHDTASLLARELGALPEIEIDSGRAHTNMVFFKTNVPGLCLSDLCERLKANGVLVGIEDKLGIRAVTHYGISHADIKEAALRVKASLAQLTSHTTMAVS